MNSQANPIPEAAAAIARSPGLPTLGDASQERLQLALGRVPALVACGLIAFGVALIANTQLTNDGVWYWYARAFLDGKRIYADLGIAQQPLFILLNAAVLDLFGPGWIPSRIPSLLAVVMHVGFALALVRRWKASPVEQGVLLAFLFFVGIRFEAYRFDDYRGPVDAITFGVAWLLLGIARERSLRANVISAIAIGLGSGLAVGTRLNDGAVVLIVGTFLVVLLAPAHRARLGAIALATGLLTFAGIILLTGDGFGAWWRASILGGAACKGGGGGLLLYPVFMPFNAAEYLYGAKNGIALRHLIGVAVAAAVLALPLRIHRVAAWLLRAALVAIIVGLAYRLVLRDPIGLVSAVGVFVAYGILAALAWRFLRAIVLRRWADVAGDERYILLLPIGLWVSGALSTGGHHYGLYFQFALFTALLAITHTGWFQPRPARAALVATLASLALTTGTYRAGNPSSWHAYQTAPLFENRSIVHHETYGAMYSDRNLVEFITPICDEIAASGKRELLSLPFPFANYYCAIPPWNGWVQSFFDTSNAAMIGRMIRQLEEAPPAWILYQRQLWNLRLHEEIFNGGQPLPHRALDEFLMRRVAVGDWKVTSSHGDDEGWLLISTARDAARPGSPGPSPTP